MSGLMSRSRESTVSYIQFIGRSRIQALVKVGTRLKKDLNFKMQSRQQEGHEAVRLAADCS